MLHPSRPRSPAPRRRRVVIEFLEGRLVPGDVLLGTVTGSLSLPAALAPSGTDTRPVTAARATPAASANSWVPPTLALVRQPAGTLSENAVAAPAGSGDLFAAVLADPLLGLSTFAKPDEAPGRPAPVEAGGRGPAPAGVGAGFGVPDSPRPAPGTTTAPPVAAPAATGRADVLWCCAAQAPVAAADDGPPTGSGGTILTDYYFQEWTIPTERSTPHDVISDDEGIIWFTEIDASQIGRFDPYLEEFAEFPLPAGARPHGIAVGPDYGIWFTEQGGNRIGRIDRETFAITAYDLPRPGSGPHTPIHDGYGRILFTEQQGNRIGRLNIEDGTIEEWQLRAGAGPYGIVADWYGNAWFCEFGGQTNRIGRIDAKTGELTEYVLPTPNAGPRRLWPDSQGMLWITANRSHQLVRFDPWTETFTEWASPNPVGSNGPYAITVDQNDMVWYSEFTANTMVRFDPTTEEFSVYEMPTPREQVRFIHVDPYNQVWYENNGNNAIGVISKGG